MGCKEKEDVNCYLKGEKNADTVGDGGDRQMQGAERKRILFSRREGQTQWVVGVTDKYRGQRAKGC